MVKPLGPSSALIFFVLALLLAAPSCKAPAAKPPPPVPAKTEPGPPSSTSPGDYDKAMIKAIQVRWLQLLDERGYGGGIKGSMTVEFKVHANGAVSDVAIVQSDLDPFFSALCQAAIRDVTPFPPWPEAMRREIGKDERTVRFSFRF